MKRIILLLTLSVPGVCTASNNIFLNIEATLSNSSCTVTGEPVTLPVNLGSISQQSLTGPDAVSAPVPFSIGLENCSNVSQVVTSFTPANAATSANLAGLTTNSTATGLAVQVLDSNQIPLDISAAQTQSLTGGTGATSGSFTWYLQYIATGATVTPGIADAVVYLDFTYQ